MQHRTNTPTPPPELSDPNGPVVAPPPPAREATAQPAAAVPERSGNPLERDLDLKRLLLALALCALAIVAAIGYDRLG